MTKRGVSDEKQTGEVCCWMMEVWLDGRTSHPDDVVGLQAGAGFIPLLYCPWCGKRIK